jgi:hypothetical protein
MKLVRKKVFAETIVKEGLEECEPYVAGSGRGEFAFKD